MIFATCSTSAIIGDRIATDTFHFLAYVSQVENIGIIMKNVLFQERMLAMHNNNKILYTPKEAHQKLNEGTVVLVDVRNAEDFEKSHIPGAVNIPEVFTTLPMTTPDGLRELQDIFVPLFRKAGIRHDQTVIVKSLSTRYGGSCRGYFQLSLLGHQDAGILDGGFAQWLQEDLPVTAEKTKVTASNYWIAVMKMNGVVSAPHPMVSTLRHAKD